MGTMKPAGGAFWSPKRLRGGGTCYKPIQGLVYLKQRSLRCGLSTFLRLAAALLCAVSSAHSVQAEETLRDQARKLFDPIPQTAPATPNDPVTPEKLASGQNAVL